MQQATTKLVLVQNQTASESALLDEAILRLTQRDIEVTKVAVGDADTFPLDEADVVIATGGDGTVNRVVNLLVEHDLYDTPLGVLPFGTGNDFAKAAGIEGESYDLLFDLLLQVEPVRIDIWELDEKLFVNATSGGFGAEITSETSPTLKQFLGRFAYSLTGLLKVFESKDRYVSIRGDGFTWEEPFLFFSIANGRYAGGGYQVGRRAYFNDGLLDVLAIPDVDLVQYPSLLSEIFDSESFDHEHVKYAQTSWLEVHTPNGLNLTVDGEPHQLEEFRVKRHPKSLPALFLERSAILDTDQ